MTKTTRAERRERHDQALKLISEGVGVSEATSLLTDQWGCSRKTALRMVRRAHESLLEDLTDIDKQHALAYMINTLQRTIHRAEKAGQGAVVVGGIRLMNELVIKPSLHNPRRRCC